jgi:hypothetical protein
MAYPLDSGRACLIEEIRVSPTITPNGPGSPVPRAGCRYAINSCPGNGLRMDYKLTY